MPKFFDKNNLTTEQKSRWDFAVVKYKKIHEKNALFILDDLSEEEKLDVIQEINQKKEFNSMLSSEVLDEKSALFSRLLDGKNPLLYPPPCSYSYPWYSVIEDEGPWNLSLDAHSVDELYWENLMGENTIAIEQTPWKVLEEISSNEVIVTFGYWEDLGFKWRLKQVEKSCKETNSFIYSHHNPSFGRITTYDELKKEQMYHIISDFDKIKLVLDAEFKKITENEIYMKYGQNGLSKNLIENNYESGKKMLNERREKGLSDYPSSDEILLLVEENLKTYFESDYSFDLQGNLYAKVWILEKISGETKDSIYMDL